MSGTGRSGSNWSDVGTKGAVVAGGIAGRLSSSDRRRKGIAGAVVEEPGEGQAILPDIVSRDGEGVTLVVLAVGPLVVQAVDEGLVGIVEGRLARVLQSRE